MISDIVARRYAHALFAIGNEKGAEELESYGRTFDSLLLLLDQSPELEKLFRAPVISAAEKEAVIGKVLSSIDAAPLMINFCRLLAEKARLGLLRAIAAAYRRQLDDACGIVRGTVTTAVPLNRLQEKTISKTLNEKTGTRMFLGFKVDPDILGGVILHLGNTVLDASLRAQLCALIDTIKRGK